MSDLHTLLDERVVLARHKAAKAAQDARRHAADPEVQTTVERRLDNLQHYLTLRDAIGAEQGPYNERSSRSFYADAVRAAVHGDTDARSRLARHTEARSTMSSYGGLVVPAVLEEKLVNSGHSTRPLVDLLAEPLPDNGASVDIPEVTTAATAEDQQTENTQVTSDDPATTARSFPVRTVWSQASVSHASVARAEGTGFDVMVNREILGAVNALEEARVIAGSGNDGQPAGILIAATQTYAVTGTTAYDMLDAVARTAAAVDAARGSAADLVVMHPRRWRWLLANSGDRSSAITPATTPGPIVGRVLGVDVVASPAMPIALGSSTDEDRVVVCRRSDLYVADAPATVEIARDHAGSASLNSLVRVVRYYAAGVVSTEGVQVLVGAGTRNPYS